MPPRSAALRKSAPAPTTAQSLSSLLKSARDIMRKDKGLNGDIDRLPMLTWIMFLKFLDDLEQQREQEAELARKKFRPAIEPPYRWRDWAANPQGITGDELLAFINQDEARRPHGKRCPGLFAYLRGLTSANGDNRRDADQTAERLRELRRTNSCIRVLRQSGKAAALVTGITAAPAPWIVTMDGDSQNRTDDLPRLLEAAWGATLGKAMVGIRVVGTGQGRSFSACAVRNVLRIVDGLGFYLVGTVVAACSAARQRVGDMYARTAVIEESFQSGVRIAAIVLWIASLAGAGWAVPRICSVNRFVRPLYLSQIIIQVGRSEGSAYFQVGRLAVHIQIASMFSGS